MVSVLTIAAALQRVITIPSVDHLLNKILLGSTPKGKNHGD